MMALKSYEDAHRDWKEWVKEAGISEHDEPAMAEFWNNYTDSLARDGEFTAKQYHFCPAWDDAMPDCPLEHVMEGLGIKIEKALAVQPSPDGVVSYMITYSECATPVSLLEKNIVDHKDVLGQVLELCDEELGDAIFGSDVAGDLRELVYAFN